MYPSHRVSNGTYDAPGHLLSREWGPLFERSVVVPDLTLANRVSTPAGSGSSMRIVDVEPGNLRHRDANAHDTPV